MKPLGPKSLVLPDAGRGSGRRRLAGAAAVTTTYVFFLLFAQFAFLELLQRRLAGGEVRLAMAAMGVAGLVASFAAGAALGRLPGRWLLAAGFAVCGLAVVAALASHSLPALGAVAAVIGVGTALVTVSLASDLGRLVGRRHLGLTVGAATGLAYLLCNLPPLFDGSIDIQSTAAVLACLLGLLAVRWSGGDGEAGWASDGGRAGVVLDRADLRGLGFATVVLSFLLLVWLDSAAFAVIQEELPLKGLTWGSHGQLLTQGSVHLLAALLAGWLIDRGHFRSLLVVAFGLFSVAFSLLGRDGGAAVAVAGPLYAVGISLYSVALVLYPALGRGGAGEVPARWRAAALFGVAGWLGSALGVGMAQDLHRVPALFSWLAGALLLAGWAWSRRWAVARLLRHHGLTLGAAAVALALALLGRPAVEPPAPPAGGAAQVAPAAFRPGAATTAALDAEAVARGRRVYVEEGCINCHSQYIRSGTRDVELWGPHRDIDRREAPPLLGNRRQGPDLANAGNRRSAVWHRQHLIAPRSLMPGSRMPSYAHLFAEGSRRGDDLVAYLASLGADSARQRYQLTHSAPLAQRLPDGSAQRGAHLFAQLCASCHGAEGHGDGPLAKALYTPAMNLQKEDYTLVSWGPGAEPLTAALARTVKFGIPRTSMPGHETLTDQQLADLVAYVESLRGRDALLAQGRHDEDGGAAGGGAKALATGGRSAP